MNTPSSSLHAGVLSSLPITLIGVTIVVFSLLYAAWPPDYLDAHFTATVSHWDRLTGNDVPVGQTVERPSSYAIRRGLDALAYYMVFQSLVAVSVLAWAADRTMYLLLLVSGGYGIIYAASMGLHIGPILTVIGFAMVLWSGLLGWSASTTAAMADGNFENIEVS